MVNQEYLFKISFIEQEAKKIEEQVQLILQQISELKNLQENIDKLDKTKENEILAGLGRGIFVKSELKEKKLFVNVGSGVIIKKTAEETKKVIEKQVGELEAIQDKLAGELEKLNFEMNNLIELAEKNEK